MAFYKISMVILIHLIISCTLTSSSSVPNNPRLLHSNLIGGDQPIGDDYDYFCTGEDEDGPIWCGGWQPIEDVNDPTIQGLAKFALTEHNRLHDARLQFGRVIEGEKQPTAGYYYRLILAASSDGKPGKYEAFVSVVPWENFRELASFRSI